jgi:hypothetical protein
MEFNAWAMASFKLCLENIFFNAGIIFERKRDKPLACSSMRKLFIIPLIKTHTVSPSNAGY